MLKTKFQTAVLSVLVFTAFLCFTACSPWQVRIGQDSGDVTNNTPKAQDEQEPTNTEKPSCDKQEEAVVPEIEPEYEVEVLPEILPEEQDAVQEPDTKIFFGEEYVKRDDVEFPKHILKNIPTGPVKKQEYKLVTPTQEEFDEIAVRLNPILSMFLFDYDCEKDNIYEFLFGNDHLAYVYPEYDEQVAEFIAKPLAVKVENNLWFWEVVGIYEDDPLKIFPISEVSYDENGNLDLDKAYAFCRDGISYTRSAIIGHNMFSGAYIDWLVEGVWNGKANHDTYMQFDNENPTQIYYYDGNYYTPEYPMDRGGGIMNRPYIQKITPLGDNKYKMIYYKNDGDDYSDEPVYNMWYETVIGLKETQDGFRFWSIFEFKYTGAEWPE